jgi:hypothetical protein
LGGHLFQQALDPSENQRGVWDVGQGQRPLAIEYKP